MAATLWGTPPILASPPVPQWGCGIKDMHTFTAVLELELMSPSSSNNCWPISATPFRGLWDGVLIYSPGLTQTQEQSSCLSILGTGITDMSQDACLKFPVVMNVIMWFGQLIVSWLVCKGAASFLDCENREMRTSGRWHPYSEVYNAGWYWDATWAGSRVKHPAHSTPLQGSYDSVRVPSINPSFFLLTHSEDLTSENLVSSCSVSISWTSFYGNSFNSFLPGKLFWNSNHQSFSRTT